jgi:hypothetical protein
MVDQTVASWNHAAAGWLWQVDQLRRAVVQIT